MYKEYRNARGPMSLKSKNLLTIDASSSDQTCEVFGLHPRLSVLQDLYESKEAIFLANVGLLTKSSTEVNDLHDIDVQLFAHNSSEYPSIFLCVLLLALLRCDIGYNICRLPYFAVSY